MDLDSGWNIMLIDSSLSNLSIGILSIMVIHFLNYLIHSSLFLFSFNLNRYSHLISNHIFNFIWNMFYSLLRNDFINNIINIFSPFYWIVFFSLDWYFPTSSHWLLFNMCLFNIFSLLLFHIVSHLIWYFINFLFCHIISHCLFPISSNRSLNSIMYLFRNIFYYLLSSYFWM
jgi:hypothetical protein